VKAGVASRLFTGVRSEEVCFFACRIFSRVWRPVLLDLALKFVLRLAIVIKCMRGG
jgi:hypothetical protein